MSIKTMLKPASLFSLVFRVFLKPAFALLPNRRRDQMITIAHHIKATLFYGQVMNFGNRGNPSQPVASIKVVTEGAAFPSWVVEELSELAKIEPDLNPTPEYLARFHVYHPIINDTTGRVYAACRRLIGNLTPDIMFIVPWLKRGGADLGTLHHINICQKLGLKTVLITTLNTESPWLDRVPKDVPVVELGRQGSGLTDAERMIVLVRLMLQSQAPIIHIIQSQLGWETVKNHGKSLLAEGKSVFASLYGDDHDAVGQRRGYARFYLPSTLPYLSGIICDSAHYPAELNRWYGVDQSRIHTVYFPGTGVNEPEYISVDKGKILWASRITYQKRPDLLLEIIMAMPDIQFHVRGHAEHQDEKQLEERISRLPNVTFTGSYEVGGLVEKNEQFSLFLYTSNSDGMPNVLLEATLAGLPIVASSVGGVPELINEETGYLVDEVKSVEAYISVIRRALANPEERRKRWSKAKELIQMRHTQESFFKQMVEIDGYFPSPAAEEAIKLRVSA